MNTDIHFSLIPRSSSLVPLVSATVENILQISSFLTNKPKVKYAKIILSSYITSKYENSGHLVNQKTNPIQTQ